jgi:hypothetical protein
MKSQMYKTVLISMESRVRCALNEMAGSRDDETFISLLMQSCVLSDAAIGKRQYFCVVLY